MKNKMTYGPEFLSVIKSVDIDSNDWDTIKFMKSICMLLGDDSAPVLTFLLNNEEDYIRETVREIIKGECYDEWQFRNAITLRIGDNYCENGIEIIDSFTGEDCSDCCFGDPDYDGSEEKIEEPVNIYGKEIQTMIEDILRIVDTSIESSIRTTILIKGKKEYGKTLILKEAVKRMRERYPGRLVLNYFDMKLRIMDGSIASYKTPAIMYCDDMDLDCAIGQNLDAEFEKISRSYRLISIITASNTAKMACIASNAIIFEIPDISVDDCANILASRVIGSLKLSKPTAIKVAINILNAGVSEPRKFMRIMTDNILYSRSRNITNGHPIFPTEVDLTIKEIRKEMQNPELLSDTISYFDTKEEIENRISSMIIGQSEVLGDISSMLLSVSQGYCDPTTPLGVYMFIGPTGVGKTEMANAIAHTIFGGKLYKEEMNTYSERHSVSRITGSPPGYIGYGDRTPLLSFIEDNSSGVILLDEIEKASDEVLKTIMELINTGIIKDTTGKSYNARNFLFILTSNVSFSEKKRKKKLGFEKEEEESPKTAKQMVEDSKEFAPEIIGRIHAITKFSELSEESRKEIASKLIGELIARLKVNHPDLETEQSILEEYIKEAALKYDKSGVRPVKAFIETTIKNRLLSGRKL